MSLRFGLAAAITCAIIGAAVVFIIGHGRPSSSAGKELNVSIFTPSAIGAADSRKPLAATPKRIERSRVQYRELVSHTAARVAQTQFRSALTGPGEGAPHLGRSERIVSFLDDHTARTRAGAKRGLLLSSLPLRTRDANGRKRPIELALERRGDAFAPRLPLVPTRFGTTLDGGLALHDLVTAVPATAAGRSSAVGEQMGSDRVFYPGIARDTDFIAESTTLGFETYWQLRSPESPERQVLRNRLARGVELRQAGDMIAILKEGKVVGQITPPTAVDAAGRSVRVEQELHGSDLELHTAHRRGGVTYPVLVDPYYMENDGNFHGEDWWHPGTPTWHSGNPEGLEAWQSYTNNNFIGAGIVCNYNVSCFDGNDLGLFLQSQPGFYSNNSGAFYQYQAQGQGASTYIDHFEGAFVVATTKGAPVTSSANFQVLNSSGGVIGDSGNVMNGAAAPSTGAGSGSGGTVARVQLKMIGDGTRSTWNSISVGGALVHITESSAPSLQSETLSWNQSQWYNGTQPITAAVTFLSTGLGVKEIHYGVPTPAGGAGEQVPYPCDGKYATRCPYSYSATFAIPTEQIPEGVNNISFGATTPAGHGSAPLSRTYRVDHTPPNEIRIYGELAGKENGTIAAGAHSFYAWASDMGCTSNGTRSGIKQITVLVDGNSVPGYGPVGGPGCTGQTGTISLNLAAGEHAIEITAIDGMGLELVKAFTVTAVPAAPINSTAPVISGIPEEGQDLTASDGAWSGLDPMTAAYQWERCTPACEPITGATSNSYHVFFGDVGATLRVRVSMTNGVGASSATSTQTGTVATIAPPPANHDIDQAIGTPVPDDGGGADVCTPDTSFEGGADCSSDDMNPLYATEAAAAGSTIKHEGYAVSDDYRTPDSLALFGGPYLKDGTCSTDPNSAGKFNSTSAADRESPDDRFRNLGPAGSSAGLTKVRLIVPYDVLYGKACNAPTAEREKFYRVSEWITGALANNKQILISFDSGMRNPGTAPSVTAYGDAVQAFRDEFPQIRDYTAWNEPNRSDAATVSSPSLAADYWVHLRWRCNRIGPGFCRVAAGDFLDSSFRVNSGEMDPYFKQYRDALGRRPGLWAIHAYSTVRRNSVALKRFLKWTGDLEVHCAGGNLCPPRVWLSEQGGLVYREQNGVLADGAKCNNADPTNGYEANITRAGTNLSDFFNNYVNSSTYAGRMTRFYYYDWNGTPTFDAGLLYTPQHGLQSNAVSCPKSGQTREPLYNVFHDQVVGAPL